MEERTERIQEPEDGERSLLTGLLPMFMSVLCV